MTLFRIALETPPPISLPIGDGLLLRSPVLEDYAQWARLRAQSRNFLIPWEPIWPEDDLTKAAFRRRVSLCAKNRQSDQSYSVFLFEMPEEILLGGLNLTQVRRGVAQMGTVSYWIGEPYARQGYMSAALPVFVKYAFDVLKLERLEAAALPHNEASIRLLRRTGFREEGRARAYLRIAGQRQDQLLFGLLPEDIEGIRAH